MVLCDHLAIFDYFLGDQIVFIIYLNQLTSNVKSFCKRIKKSQSFNRFNLAWFDKSNFSVSTLYIIAVGVDNQVIHDLGSMLSIAIGINLWLDPHNSEHCP